MQSNYKKIGEYIELVDERNRDLSITNLLGLSVNKIFIPSVANIIGSDMANYKIIRKGQFACSLMQVRRDGKIPVALLEEFDEAIISQAYPVFEIKNTEELLPQYLMMWMSRSEFDRRACFLAVGGVRGSLEWEDFCDMELPVPSIEKQREIVKEYNVIINRINLNEQLNQKLEETAQAIYKQWFVDFEFPISSEYATSINRPDLIGKPYKSNGGEMIFNEELEQSIPKGWTKSQIGSYAQVKSGYAFKSSWWQQSGIPVIKIGSIRNNTIDFNGVDYVNKDKIKSASNYIVKEGDIVIAMTGATIGKIGLVPNLGETILVNQRVGMFDLGTNAIEKAPFLYCSLLQEYVMNEILNVGGDSAQANMSNTQIQDILLILPTYDLINAFNKTFAIAFKIILEKIFENNKLNEMTGLLLSSMASKQLEAVS